MSESKRNHDDADVAEGILDADDTGLVRNEVDIVEEEVEEGLSPDELPVDDRGAKGPTDSS